MTSDLLLWLDVETTGFLPWRDRGKPRARLLQVAAIVTDDLLQVCSSPHEWVVQYRPDQVAQMRSNASPVVVEMHDKTGLWDRLPTGTPLCRVDVEFSAWLKSISGGQFRVAGNSVRLDLNFAEAYLPITYQHVNYQSLDVSALQFEALATGKVTHEFPKRGTHNAIDDLHESMAQLAWLRKAS